MFSYVSIEDRIPAEHPLRAIQALVNPILSALSPRFQTLPAYDAERDAAVEMLTTLEPRARRRTLGADKGYDATDFVAGVRACHTTRHVSPNIHERRPTSAIDERTTRHAGFAVSQVKRKLVEEGFGWDKTIGGLRKLRHRGTRHEHTCRDR